MRNWDYLVESIVHSHAAFKIEQALSACGCPDLSAIQEGWQAVARSSDVDTHHGRLSRSLLMLFGSVLFIIQI